ncbi:inhibitor of apoptosis repeat-containing protein [Mycena vitilis]|nr:inhibitor of apoptosis repeat-containing protein [Mycena vitilis]
MEVLQNRLNSFVKQKRGKSLKWPHPKTWKTNPDTLAEAGFYFDPSAEDPDNATCFMCNKQVTEWAEEDDPFDIHWEKCANVCAWANVRCGLRRDADAHGRFVFPDKSRLPTSKAMEKARLETFTAHGWKHDKNKKHLASSKKMAHAGFVFTPAEAGDDTGTCLYCQVALGNWDEDDDPMQNSPRPPQSVSRKPNH